MAEMKTLSVRKRSALGKGANRRLRAESLVPGVYYTAGGVNVPVQAPALPLGKIYEQVGRTNVFNLEIDDNGVKTLHPVFVWDAQYHPVKNVFTHVDFFGVDMDKDIKVEVPLEFVGVSKGVKLGGSLETYREHVTLLAKPLHMPRKITVDVTSLELGQSFRVSDLALPEGVRALAQTDFVLVAVVTEKDEAENAEASAESAA
jgi:large subunit ribosomal protein L25